MPQSVQAPALAAPSVPEGLPAVSPPAEKKGKVPFWAFAVFGKFAKLAKVFKAVKVFKLLLTLGTMAISVFVYSFQYGFAAAFGLVLLLFVHEMGHVAAAVRKGHPASAPIFIPMLGAVIFAPPFKSSDEEAYVGFGGPFVGALSAFALFGLYLALPTKIELLLLLSYLAAFLNLFNLIPLSPLDGGRVTQAVGRWFKIVGFALLGALTLYVRDPGLLLIWLFSLDEIRMHPRTRHWACVAIWGTMTVLLALGYGTDPGWWSGPLHVLSGGMFLLMFAYKWQQILVMRRQVAEHDESASPWVRERLAEADVAEATPRLPPPPLPARLKWLALYLGLVGALVALMLVQIPLLPHVVRAAGR